MDRVREQSRVMTAIAVVFVTVWILRESGGILHLGDLFCTRSSGLRCKSTDATGDSWFSSMLQEKRRGMTRPRLAARIATGSMCMKSIKYGTGPRSSVSRRTSTRALNCSDPRHLESGSTGSNLSIGARSSVADEVLGVTFHVETQFHIHFALQPGALQRRAHPGTKTAPEHHISSCVAPRFPR